MGTPYSSGPHILEVVGGEARCIQIKTPHRGIIKSVKFEQVAGNAAACTFEVFTSAKACPPGSSQSSESLSEGVEGPRSAYSIFGQKAMSAGSAFEEYEKDYYFTNKDGTPTNPQRKLYVELIPDGSDPVVYALTLEMETSLLG